MSDGASTAYQSIYDASLRDPEGFWREAAESIDWVTPPRRILDDSNPPFYRWFPDAELNVCFNALDRHVAAGRGDQAALHYDSPVTGTKRTLSYTELLDEVSRFAGALASLGVDKGDRVVIYMPMVPEAVVAMLACARLGAIHSVVFGGFAPAELAARIEDAEPKVVVSASCGVEPSRVVRYKPMLDEALERSTHKPESVIVLQREQGPAEVGQRDTDWEEMTWAEVMGDAEPTGCVTVAATDPLYILYTSGTTGKPKGIYRDSGGYAVALRWSMANVYDVAPGETMFTASDVGWVVGHSYIVYAPLLTGATTVLYEGKPVGTPDAGAFWRVIAEYGAVCLFTAPTAFRAIKRDDSTASALADHDLSRFRALFLAGERLDPDTYEWASAALGKPVVDNWWQTETGWPIAANPVGVGLLPIKAGSPT
ncbi:MAG: AMP-binding protein, partial [Humibacillus sp.]